MKGIILAGGSGTRLFPLTSGTSKQLLPVYDKPMIYYPLSVLMLSQIRDILIITTAHDIQAFQRLLGDGSQWGLNLSYAVQPKANGLAEAFIIGESFIGHDRVCLVLGDNLFYGQSFSQRLLAAKQRQDKATIFAYKVKDPQRYGIVEVDADFNALSIEEKPSKPKSNYAVTGLYYYDNDVIAMAKSLTPSTRGELEITDINKLYLAEKKLQVECLGRGFVWLDTGTHDSLLEASHFVQTIEKRQGYKIACLEEIAYRQGWINSSDIVSQTEQIKHLPYGEYLLDLMADEH